MDDKALAGRLGPSWRTFLRQQAASVSLRWLLVLGRRHIERVLRAYTDHYNGERRHRGLALLPPAPTDSADLSTSDPVHRRDRLRGLIHEYHRAAT